MRILLRLHVTYKYIRFYIWLIPYQIGEESENKVIPTDKPSINISIYLKMKRCKRLNPNCPLENVTIPAEIEFSTSKVILEIMNEWPFTFLDVSIDCG